MDADIVTHKILGAEFRVHSRLGPGLLESTYEACLEYEVMKLGFRTERQIPVPLRYGELFVETAYRLDLLVDGRVIVRSRPSKSSHRFTPRSC
jgi:GxxExxY protein